MICAAWRRVLTSRRPAIGTTIIYARLGALPDGAEPSQRSQLMAALSVGDGIIQLRRIAPRLGLGSDLDVALDTFALGKSAIVTAQLARLDDRLASLPDGRSGAPLVFRARASILVISQALVEHASYFDAG